MMNDSIGQATKEQGIFDSLLYDLDKAISQATTDAETYKNYMNKLDSLTLECDLKNQEEELSRSIQPIERPDNVIIKLRTLINQLKAINIKNAEILKHFDTLV
jgi:hypothetical protein